MTDNLKPCPFCGKKPNPNWTDESYIECTNRKCSVYGYGMSTGDWNTRPIEDELQKRIAELKGAIEILEDQQREATNFLIDKKLHIDSLYEEGYKLQKRIAELEALVDELKPYRDGYDPEEAFPPEGEWVWLRDCDDNIEIMGYSQKEKCYWNYEGYWMPDDGDIRRWYPIGKLPEVQE